MSDEPVTGAMSATIKAKRENRPPPPRPAPAYHRVVVYHRGFGCDTGCCGHVVMLGDKEIGGFHFDHPHGQVRIEFAADLANAALAAEFGPAHVADLDWKNCIVVDHDDD